MKDALETLGTKIDKTAKRDAVHIAVFPAIAVQRLFPGEKVYIDSYCRAFSVKHDGHHGIVDPFLQEDVQEGEVFWVMVNPRTITSLRHDWEHPDLNRKIDTHLNNDIPYYDVDEEINDTLGEEKEQAERFLMNFANRLGVSFDDLLYYAGENLVNGEYLHIGNNESQIDQSPAMMNDFWDNYEIYTGNNSKVRNGFNRNRPFFSCSC